MSQESEKPRPFIYFQPAQIIFHVVGDFDGNTAPLFEWAGSVAEKNGVKGISLTEPPASQDPEKPAIPAVYRFDFVKEPGSMTHVDSKIKAYLQPAGVSNQPGLLPILNIFKTGPKAKLPPPFTLVLAYVKNDRWPPFLADPNPDTPEKQEYQKAQAAAFDELFRLILLLDKNRKSAPVTLEVVSPNWLMSGGPSSPGSTGGPGGRPFPATQSDITGGKQNFNLATVYPTLVPGLAPGVKPEDGKDVVVAILDTSYPEGELERMKTAWPQHELITKLLGPTGALRGVGGLNLHPDATAERYLPDLMIEDHDYDMTDHGLFVAGIINSLAPNAELHLYQVLNKYGMGDLLSIARALQDVLTRFGDRPVVVNMSLTMNMPLEEAHCSEKDNTKLGLKILEQKPKPEWFWSLIRWICRILQWILQWFFPKLNWRCRWSWFDRAAISFEWIDDLVHVLGPGVIAAAGNAGQTGHRPSALYPAAFDSVLGVGALARGKPWNRNVPLKPASFSNLADTPTTQGVMAFGGEEGQGNGVLGVYMGKILDERSVEIPNPAGWAWWSGTSFATPIVSGMVANLVISGQAANVQDAIQIVLNTSRRGGYTPDFEGKIMVEQPTR